MVKICYKIVHTFSLKQIFKLLINTLNGKNPNCLVYTWNVCGLSHIGLFTALIISSHPISAFLTEEARK